MIIEPTIVTSETSIRDLMAALESAEVKICVLVDESGRLRRTVVDGDIRRALLSGLSLHSAVAALPEQLSICLPSNSVDKEIARVFKNNPTINAIVMIDGDKRPTGVIPRSAFSSSVLLSPPHMGESESVYVQKAFDENWIAPAGPNLNTFEELLKAASGRQHTLAVNSGTAALHLALRVLGVGAGHRVYVSDLTFAATLQPILYQNSQPVLIDSEPETWNMSPVALKRRFELDAVAGQLPKAIVVVHLYGQSANIDAILDLADQYNVPVIEDAAESVGGSYGKRPSGSHGLLAAYSFNGNKIITTSGGGALVSDREDLIERARKLSTQGRDPAEHYQHSIIAYNYRMSNVLAGIGIGQLELLPARVAQRREVFETYRQALGDIPGLNFQCEAHGSNGNRWLTVISLDPDFIPRHPYQLLRELRQDGIESRPAWKPMHMQPLCAGCHFEPHSETEVISSTLFLQSLCLPSGSMLSAEQQQRVISRVRDFTKG